jgi:hypothetical protein
MSLNLVWQAIREQGVATVNGFEGIAGKIQDLTKHVKEGMEAKTR